MHSKTPLNIFFNLDKAFIIHFTVTLTSILENNKDMDISVYVLHDLDDLKVLEHIDIFFKEKYGISIKLLQVDISIFDNFLVSDTISKASYFRLLFADILPVYVNKGLYIDCDTVVTGSLKHLAELSFLDDNYNQYSLLAVSDKNGKDELVRFNNMGVQTKMYFNAGVLFINLQKWRQDAVSPKLIQLAKDFKANLKWHDQDVLNIFFRNQCGSLDRTYNEFSNKKLVALPKIIHFTGSSKPWQFLNEHPYKGMYWKYLKLTPFKKEQFEEITLRKIFKKYKDKLKQMLGLE